MSIEVADFLCYRVFAAGVMMRLVWAGKINQEQTDQAMGIYLKWSTIILGPAVIAGTFIFYYLHKNDTDLSRQELDRSYDAVQIERLERQRAEKARADAAYQRQQRNN